MSDTFHGMMNNVTVTVNRVDSRKTPHGSKVFLLMAHLLDISAELTPGCKHFHAITRGSCGLRFYLAGLANTES